MVLESFTQGARQSTGGADAAGRRVLPSDQGGGMARGISGWAMAPRAALADIECGAFFGSAVAGWKLLPVGADGDIPGADFFGSRIPAEAVSGRLGPGGLTNREGGGNEDKPSPVPAP